MTPPNPRVLIACLGNIESADDAFGVEVARRLATVTLPEGVRLMDFGTQSADLTSALADGYESVILVDATPRGGAPGTLHVMEPMISPSATGEAGGFLLAPHGSAPARVLRQVVGMGGRVGRLVLLGCEPEPVTTPEALRPGLGPSAQLALDDAVPLVLLLVDRLLNGEPVGEAHQIATTPPQTRR